MDKKIKNLLENGYFHMTSIENLYGTDGVHGIKLEGLKSAIGENSKVDSEPEKTICFSKGIDGVYETISRFLRANILISKMEKEEAFEHFEKFLSDQVYLNLDLKEGRDFDTSFEHNTYRRDMHSVPGLVIEPEKINMVCAGSSVSALDLLKYSYANYKDTYLKKENLQFIENPDIAKYVDLLNEFMEERVQEEDKQKNLHINPITEQKNLKVEKENDIYDYEK